MCDAECLGRPSLRSVIWVGEPRAVRRRCGACGVSAWGLGLSLGLYAHDAAVACSALEHDGAVGQRIEGVIGTHTHVLAGVVSGAALANDDVAGYASLSAPDLNTQTL